MERQGSQTTNPRAQPHRQRSRGGGPREHVRGSHLGVSWTLLDTSGHSWRSLALPAALWRVLAPRKLVDTSVMLPSASQRSRYKRRRVAGTLSHVPFGAMLQPLCPRTLPANSCLALYTAGQKCLYTYPHSVFGSYGSSLARCFQRCCGRTFLPIFFLGFIKKNGLLANPWYN